MKSIPPEARHDAFRADLIVLLNKHSGHLSAEEMLALAAHIVGQIIAMQDQRKYNRDMVMAIVVKNIEQGNADAIANLFSPQGGA